MGNPPEPGWFRTTHWSVVLAAGRPDSPQAAAALEQLCRAYWYPLYAYARRRGQDEEDARDLTQSFFCDLLQREGLREVTRDRGRFRSFLLAGMKNHLANAWDHARRQKRGGGATVLSLDAEAPEERYRLEPVDDATPERLFERRWAHAVVEQVVRRLAAEQDDDARRERFAVLRPFLLRQPQETGYEAAAQRLGLSVPAVTSAIHRLRLRFRELFRAEIAHTVADPAEVDEEIRHLVQVLSQPEPAPHDATGPPPG
ncbi:MAG TPA: sigma-70 family RNA polymerase sigma factor [Verrucomicrobiota bacterium]|nr:sigma-70 family RNA polymerase sigma factor [Verrucomicrobiota bacterium]